jgi:AcrR family transcriptional regulator
MRVRKITTAQTRQAILDAVHALLEAPETGRLTLDEVARTAGVTRVTVYNQFGSRHALLTAAFADQGRLIRYDRVVAATGLDDPVDALHATLRELCRAWETIPLAIRRVLALAVLDAEIGDVVDRYEQARRAQMAGLAERLGAPVGAPGAATILGALTHPLVYFQFRAEGSAASAARRLSHAVVAALAIDAAGGVRPRT